jgi:hypothetical protein
LLKRTATNSIGDQMSQRRCRTVPVHRWYSADPSNAPMQDPAHVRLGGLLGDEQRRGDLGVGQAERHQAQHLPLPVGEPVTSHHGSQDSSGRRYQAVAGGTHRRGVRGDPVPGGDPERHRSRTPGPVPHPQRFEPWTGWLLSTRY